MQSPPPSPEAEQPGRHSSADQICDKQNVEEHKQNSQDSVKSKRNLLCLRGFLIEGFLHLHCPICDGVHVHEWPAEEVVPAACGDKSPFVKNYRVAPLKKSQVTKLTGKKRGEL